MRKAIDRDGGRSGRRHFFSARVRSRRAPRIVPVADAGARAARTVAGAYHIHSARSDGSGDAQAIAAAAARAGLKFVILTDHGDATRVPDPPAYIAGVLCIDAVEISTNGGHYVALGLGAAPYPLGGEAAAVVEDVARLGGFGFAAHPDSSRPELAWTRLDAAIRRHRVAERGQRMAKRDPDAPRASGFRLLRAARTRARVHTRSAGRRTLAHWDALTSTRQVSAIAGHDAHGGIRQERRVSWNRAIRLAPRRAVVRGELPVVQHACRARERPDWGRRCRCLDAARRDSSRADVHEHRRGRRSGASRLPRRSRACDAPAWAIRSRPVPHPSA